MKTCITPLILFLFTVTVSLGSVKLIAQPVNDHITDAINLGEGPLPFKKEDFFEGMQQISK
ncbi:MULTISPECIES: hypothetical protein [Altibacter]|uniref:hypothetical protein n=1 Tax=Altibacter TaxID=1535231 RepID=UPI0005594412|nr:MULTISPECIES: hypothetical protein [Altibacter]MCW8981181.1 hypothetical protein [Altibacter sp.]MCW9036325.1 hypothetical protein [Altibacter sp.]